MLCGHSLTQKNRRLRRNNEQHLHVSTCHNSWYDISFLFDVLLEADPVTQLLKSNSGSFQQFLMASNITTSQQSSATFLLPVSVSAQVGVAILGLAFLLGFPGNLFVVWSVFCQVKKRSVTCVLVLNLAMADAFVLLSAPLFLRYLAGGRGWEFGSAACKLVHYLSCVNMYVSIYLILLMSMDRWLAVSRPFLSQRMRTKRSLLVLLLGVWVLAFVLAVPMLFYRRWVKIFLSSFQLTKTTTVKGGLFRILVRIFPGLSVSDFCPNYDSSALRFIFHVHFLLFFSTAICQRPLKALMSLWPFVCNTTRVMRTEFFSISLRPSWAAWCPSLLSTPVTPQSSAVWKAPCSTAEVKAAAWSWWSYLPLPSSGCPITSSTW